MDKFFKSGGYAPWSAPLRQVQQTLGSKPGGLSEEEARRRTGKYGFNEVAPKKKRSLALQFLSYFFSPLILMLLTVGTASYYLNTPLSAAIIYFMVLVSVSLTFYSEYTAQDAAEKLRKLIRNTAAVVRDGKQKEIPLRYIVPGDTVRLSAGDLVPADCRVISCKDFFVNQASLTGESLPVEKSSEAAGKDAGITDLANAVFFGSSVVSGSAEALVLRTGDDTQFGELARRLAQSGTETDFDRGIRNYSILMIKFIFVLVVSIFLINTVLKNDLINSLLFALAVAVGLTPEMLPVIVTANLSQGANNMAKKEVIVKRLSSIQNLGAMDVLCTDKTGTLTEDRIELVRHINADEHEDEYVLDLAFLNSHHQTGLRNPLDLAIIEKDSRRVSKETADYRKIDEIPFDFQRRRMSVIVQKGSKQPLLIAKGAPEGMLPLCKSYKTGGRSKAVGGRQLANFNKIYEQLSSDGYRVLALGSKRVPKKSKSYKIADESGLTFEGFLAFLDPPKPSAHQSLAELVKRGIEVKILSGDNELVNQKIAKEVGLNVKGVITGKEIAEASDESLQVLVERNTIFARVLPMQKERIILALHRNKHVVGYLGDGINDALALKTSDVGISVDSAVDVAKESADIILLRKSLHVLYEGVDEGRRTFNNTLKYLRMGASSNFGNVFSVVGSSIFLPFLPMAPLQLILNNFLYDMSQVGIPSDNVDEEALLKPVKWSLEALRNFVVFIGPISSIFDYITFGVLLFLMHAPEHTFQTGWFVESLVTQTIIIHVIRTNKKPFIESFASKRLTLISMLIILVGLAIVATPFRAFFGMVELPTYFYYIVIAEVIGYVILTQLVKEQLLKRGIIS